MSIVSKPELDAPLPRRCRGGTTIASTPRLFHIAPQMPNRTSHYSVADLKSAALINTLRSCRLFVGLAPEDLHAVAEITVVKSLAKEDYLFREGDASHGFYIVQKGGHQRASGEFLGQRAGDPRFRAESRSPKPRLPPCRATPGDARAVESSQVLLVQKDGFLSLLRRQPELALRCWHR